MIRVFIQNEAGSLVKHVHDEKTLVLRKRVRVSRPYPFAYGFVIGTTNEDGLNVDCFVLTSHRLSTGDIVECDPIGLMEQIEDGKEDHNVLAILPGDTTLVDNAIRSQLEDFVMHVFDHVKGKQITTGDFLDGIAAVELIRRRQDPEAPDA